LKLSDAVRILEEQHEQHAARQQELLTRNGELLERARRAEQGQQSFQDLAIAILMKCPELADVVTALDNYYQDASADNYNEVALTHSEDARTFIRLCRVAYAKEPADPRTLRDLAEGGA
jgi:uncharacterized protein YigA (DUF484 family)